MFYIANLLMRLQESILKIRLKEEKAKVKVQRMKGESTGLARNSNLQEILRLKLENDRFLEKIAVLNKALFEVRLKCYRQGLHKASRPG